MADKPENLRSNRVSRHTMVIRKAAAEDAKKHGGVSSSETSVMPRTTTADGARPAKDEIKGGRSGPTSIIVKEGKAVSGRFVSTRFDGSRASVRLKAGDAVIRTPTGETLIRRRTAPKAARGKSVLWGYGVFYLVAFVLYGVFLFTGTHETSPEQYLSRAFSKRRGDTVLDLERAAYAAMRGNRTPAEVRLAMDLNFYDESQEMVKVAAGDRLTLLTAAKLGTAIIKDLERPPAGRTLPESLVLYDETWLASIDWPYWLMLYNLLGFFLLAAVFLWKPIREFLGTQGNKTIIALDNARKAQDEAENIRDGFRSLASELEQKRETLLAEVARQAEAEHVETIEHAKRQAVEIASSGLAAMEAEFHSVLAGLKSRAAHRACGKAHELLASKASAEDHDRAMDALIDDIAGMKL